MSKSMILQMTGRAGRPGFDSSGTAVIMTSQEDRAYFSTLDLDVVESTLPSILTETICAEVSQRVIQTVSECVAWLKNTFFFIRVKLNPTKYGFSAQLRPAQLEELLVQLCVRALEDLKRAEVVDYAEGEGDGDGVVDKVEGEGGDSDNMISVTAKPAAHIMTKHMIKLKTMSSLMNIPSSASIYDVVATVSKAEELAKPVLRSEKKVLNELMKDVRYPLKKLKVQEPFHKAYVLLLCAVYKNKFDSFNVTNEQNNSHSVLTDFALRVQQSEIVEQCLRVLSALFDYCIEKSKGKVTLSCLYLVRALKIQIWEEGFHVFDQCKELPFVINSRLRRENIHEIDDVLSCPSTQMQKTLRCSQDVLQTIYTFAKKEKCSGLMADFQPFYNKHNEMISFKVHISTRISGTNNVSKYEAFFQARRQYHLVVVDNHTSELLCYRKFYSKLEPEQFTVKMASSHQQTLGRHDMEEGKKGPKSLKVCLICDQTIGQDYSMDFPPVSTSPETDSDTPQSTQQKASASASNRKNKIRKTSQSLLSFPTPPPKKKKQKTASGPAAPGGDSPTEDDGEWRRKDRVSNNDTKKRARRPGSSTEDMEEEKDSRKKSGVFALLMCAKLMPLFSF
jgi:hypothetical protein